MPSAPWTDLRARMAGPASPPAGRRVAAPSAPVDGAVRRPASRPPACCLCHPLRRITGSRCQCRRDCGSWGEEAIGGLFARSPRRVAGSALASSRPWWRRTESFVGDPGRVLPSLGLPGGCVAQNQVPFGARGTLSLPLLRPPRGHGPGCSAPTVSVSVSHAKYLSQGAGARGQCLRWSQLPPWLQQACSV